MNRKAIDPHAPLTGADYADGGGEIYGAEEDDVDGIMLAHFGGDKILQRLWELADHTGSFLMWPDADVYMAVTHPATLDHMPAEFLKERDKIGIARSALELKQVIGLTD